MIDVQKELSKAVQHFWKTRRTQHKNQGAKTGNKDAGARGAVTGGKHADGFVNLVAGLVKDAGLKDIAVHTTSKTSRTLPGFFRPTKEWDLVVTSGSDLIAAIEVKSQVGSFGNNFNNRVEEALGNATDFWTAYSKGIYKPSQRPWLGYIFMLEEHEKSIKPTKRVNLSPFNVDEPFQGRSYAKRYELVCEHLLRERLYDAACFFTSNSRTGKKGTYSEPNVELDIRHFSISLHARATAFVKLKGK